MSKVYLWFNLSTTVLVLLRCSVGAFHCFAQNLNYLSIFVFVLQSFKLLLICNTLFDGKRGMDNGWSVIAISSTIRVDKIKYFNGRKGKRAPRVISLLYMVVKQGWYRISAHSLVYVYFSYLEHLSHLLRVKGKRLNWSSAGSSTCSLLKV